MIGDAIKINDMIQKKGFQLIVFKLNWNKNLLIENNVQMETLKLLNGT